MTDKAQVQLTERDIMRKALENMMTQKKFDEARRTLIMLVATYHGVMIDTADFLGYEREMGEELPTPEQLIAEFCTDATKACQMSMAMLGALRDKE